MHILVNFLFAGIKSRLIYTYICIIKKYVNENNKILWNFFGEENMSVPWLHRRQVHHRDCEVKGYRGGECSFDEGLEFDRRAL